MNWARITRKPRRFANIREIFSHDSYKIKAHPRLFTILKARGCVKSHLRLKDVTNTCKRPTIGEISSVEWRKVGRS